MKIETRSFLGFTRGLLVLALVSIVHLDVAESFTSAFANEFEFPAHEPRGDNIGPPQSGLMRWKVVPWQKPTEPAPAWLDQNTDKNEREASIRSSLDQRLDIDFSEVPLSGVMEFIAEKLDISIHLDDKALEDEAITPDEPITWKQSNVKARDAINQILGPLNLTYKIDMESVLITTRNSHSNIVRGYDLSCLLPDSSLLPELIGAIESMVEPTEWEVAGRTSAIRTVGCILLVSAPEETQLSIERLLRQISKQLPANMKRHELEAKPAPPTTSSTTKFEDKAPAKGMADSNATGGGVASGAGVGNAKSDGGVAVGTTGIQTLPDQQKEEAQNWEKPKNPAPQWLDEEIDVSEVEAKIRQALDERCELNFNGTPLSGVMKFFKSNFDIPIIIDDQSLEEEGLSSDESITLELPKTSFRDSMRLVLTPLNLTYVIQKEYMVITTNRSKFVSVRNYDLSFILPDSGLTNEIIGTIEAVVFPDKWQVAGGFYTMSSVGSMLVVRADEETHYEIQRLLRSISKQPPANMKPRLFRRDAINKPLGQERPKPNLGGAPF